jgi:hypothetical protein
MQECYMNATDSKYIRCFFAMSLCLLTPGYYARIHGLVPPAVPGNAVWHTCTMLRSALPDNVLQCKQVKPNAMKLLILQEAHHNAVSSVGLRYWSGLC